MFRQVEIVPTSLKLACRDGTHAVDLGPGHGRGERHGGRVPWNAAMVPMAIAHAPEVSQRAGDASADETPDARKRRENAETAANWRIPRTTLTRTPPIRTTRARKGRRAGDQGCCGLPRRWIARGRSSSPPLRAADDVHQRRAEAVARALAAGVTVGRDPMTPGSSASSRPPRV